MYATQEQRLHNEVLKETVFMRRHDSGTPVYLCPKPGFQKRYACFATHFGSVDASFATAVGGRHDVPDGVAHFLEHKVFEGKKEDAFEEFFRLGASCNAYTSFGVTNYLFSCSDNFLPSLSHLVRFVREPHFTEANVEKEKGIIAQEIRMYEDNPGWCGFFNLLECLYQKHPIRKNIAGTVESISAIDKDVLYDCYNTFYHPENMILFAIGDIDKDEFFEHSDALLAEQSYDPLGGIERFYPEEGSAIAHPSRMVSMEVSMPRIVIGFKDRDTGYGGRAYLEKKLVTELLLEIIFGKGGDFFQTHFASHLIDDGFSSSYTGLPDAGHTLLGGETPDPERLFRGVMEELDRVRSQGIDPADFDRQRRAAMGSFFRSFNSLEFIANNFCAYRFSDTDLFEIIEILHGIDVAQLEDRLRSHLMEDGAAYSVVNPKAAERL